MDFDSTIAVEYGTEVYVPAEDSRLLLESVVLERGERFLEVGTGSGLIALHAARLGTVYATDTNRSAAVLALANARRNGLSLRVVRTDLAAGVRGPFDVVAFNPPYLEGRSQNELERAWAGGRGGSDVSLRFLRDLPRILAPDGRAYLLLSRSNRAAYALAESTFRVRWLSSRRLFFELLEVLELRQRGP